MSGMRLLALVVVGLVVVGAGAAVVATSGPGLGLLSARTGTRTALPFKGEAPQELGVGTDAGTLTVFTHSPPYTGGNVIRSTYSANASSAGCTVSTKILAPPSFSLTTGTAGENLSVAAFCPTGSGTASTRYASSLGLSGFNFTVPANGAYGLAADWTVSFHVTLSAASTGGLPVAEANVNLVAYLVDTTTHTNVTGANSSLRAFLQLRLGGYSNVFFTGAFAPGFANATLVAGDVYRFYSVVSVGLSASVGRWCTGFTTLYCQYGGTAEATINMSAPRFGASLRSLEVSPTSSVTFTEGGLPSGTNWTVTFNGVKKWGAGNHTFYGVLAGTFPFSIGPVTGFAPTPASGSVMVSGAPVTQPIAFQRGYSVTFTERGLPFGTSWSATLDDGTKSGSGNIVFAAVVNGTHAFTIGPVAGYAASPASGSLTVSGANMTEAIAFAYTAPTTYAVMFTEAGLPSGTAWSLTLGGSPESVTASMIVFAESNGSYAFSVASVAGYTVSPSSGSITVDGHSVAQVITFSPPPGAPAISSFLASSSTIVLGSSVTFTATATGGTAPLTYAYTGLPMGCASADTSALTCTPTATGNFTVLVAVTDAVGQSTFATVGLIINPAMNPGGGPTGNTMLGLPALEGYAVLGAIAAALGVGGTLAVVRSTRRRGNGPRPPPPPWPPG